MVKPDDQPAPVKFRVYQDSSGEWRWRLRTANGRTVADSAEGYKTYSGCLRAVDRMQRFRINDAAIELIDG